MVLQDFVNVAISNNFSYRSFGFQILIKIIKFKGSLAKKDVFI